MGRRPKGDKAMTNAERQRRFRSRTRTAGEEGESGMPEAAQSQVEQLRPQPPALPETRTDLMAHYKLKRKRSINDLVEEIVVKIWENEEFQKLVSAIYDSDAVHGSMGDDDTMAALMIKGIAEKDQHVEVASKNLHTIKLAMRVALRRFDQGRGNRFDAAELPAPTPSAPAAPQAAE